MTDMPSAQTSWHLTDNEHFALDPTVAPQDNTFALQDRSGLKGLYMGDPAKWRDGYNYVRPFVAEIEHPAVQAGRWGGEGFLPAEMFPQSRVKRVIPYDAWADEHYYSKPYTGSDVREMAPEEIAAHKQLAQNEMANRSHTIGVEGRCPACGESDELYRTPSNSGGESTRVDCMACGKQSLWPARTAGTPEDYRGQHTAPGPGFGAPMHDLTQGDLLPANVYTHPQYYTRPVEPELMESLKIAHGVRGQPAAIVPIYRASPEGELHSGDWVTPSHSYACGHARQDSAQDASVWKYHVPASSLWTDGDSFAEWGYHGAPLTSAVPHVANVLDPISATLDPTVWDHPDKPEPQLKHEHRNWLLTHIAHVLGQHGYDDMDTWGTLVLTGSLTTYQYSEHSDVDISLFVNSEQLPEWSRSEMIGVMVKYMDGTTMPGTTHPLQCYVVAPSVHREDLYRPGLRSGYDITTNHWIEPPDPSRVHDVKREEVEAYAIALEGADKLESLLRHEPDKALQYAKQVHHRRLRDQVNQRGDFAPSNIIWKMLEERGLIDRASELGRVY